MPHLVANEYYCMTLAKRMGFPVVVSDTNFAGLDLFGLCYGLFCTVSLGFWSDSSSSWILLSSGPSIERGSPKTMVAAFVTQSQSDHTIMFKSIAHAFVTLTFVTNLQLVQLVGYKDSSDCYSISDSDNKNLC